MRSWTKASIAVALALELVACAVQLGKPAPVASRPAPKAPPPVAKTPVQEIDDSTALTIAATVKSIDAERRTVKLRTPAGRWSAVTVDDRVKNLDRLHAGEQVTASYDAIELRRLDAPKSGVAGGSSDRRVDPLPASTGGFRRSLVAKVIHVDRNKLTAVLEEPEGDQLKIHVKNPARLERVTVGDTMAVTYLEGRTVAIERAPSSYQSLRR
jgi:hypothetical protein